MNRALRLGAFLVATSFLGLAGDLTITFQNSGKLNTGTSTTYYSANATRTNHEGTQTDHMTDLQAGVSYTIRHDKKKIEKISFDDLAAMAEAMEGQMAQLRETMANMPDFAKKMMGDPDAFSVDELGPDTVAGRKCNKYRMVVGKLEQEMSLDPTLKIPMNPANYAKFSKFRGLLQGAVGPMAGSFKRLYEEMAKLKGVPLRTSMKMPFVGEIISEATSVKEGPIPASAFALPAGYATEDVGKKMLEQARKNGGRR